MMGAPMGQPMMNGPMMNGGAPMMNGAGPMMNGPMPDGMNAMNGPVR